MALPLPPANKVDDPARPPAPATMQVTAAEWNQAIQAIAELQGQVAASVVLAPEIAAAALPEASAEMVGRIFRVTATDEPDVTKQCLRNGDGTFSWVVLAQAS